MDLSENSETITCIAHKVSRVVGMGLLENTGFQYDSFNSSCNSEPKTGSSNNIIVKSRYHINM